MKKEVFSLFFGALFLTALYCIYIRYVGYDRLVGLIILTSIASLFFFKFNIYKWLLFSTLFFMLFDNSKFLFTQFNFRLWYFLVIPLSVFFLLVNRRRKITLESLSLFFVILLALIYAINDGILGVLFFVKYVIYGLGAYAVFKLVIRLPLVFVINMFLFLVLFVSFIGFVQFYFNLHGDFMFMDAPDLRPRAFFSETTWYGTLLVFGLIMLIPMTRLSKYYSVFYPIFLLGMVLSVSRNPFLALAIALVILGLLKLHHLRLNDLVLGGGFIVGLSFLFMIMLSFTPMGGMFEEKFLRIGDASATGRLEAFVQSWHLIQDHFFVGIGFLNSIQVEGSGTTIGSKSFNALFMVFHVLGFFGFLVISLLIAKAFLNCIQLYYRKSHLGFGMLPVLWMSSFLTVSFFAPVIQFSLSPMIIGVMIGYYSAVTNFVNFGGNH